MPFLVVSQTAENNIYSFSQLLVGTCHVPGTHLSIEIQKVNKTDLICSEQKFQWETQSKYK